MKCKVHSVVLGRIEVFIYIGVLIQSEVKIAIVRCLFYISVLVRVRKWGRQFTVISVVSRDRGVIKTHHQ